MPIPPPGLEWFLARVEDRGPNGEDDYPDDRYWVRRGYCNTNSADPTTAFGLEPFVDGSAAERYVTATNGLEPEQQHGVTVGSIVLVYAFMDSSSPQKRRYVFFATPQMRPVLKITGTTLLATNIWQYEGYKQWADVSGGRVVWSDRPGADLLTTIFNLAEANNTGVGVIPSVGVDVDGADFPAGFSVQPLAVNRPVYYDVKTINGVDYYIIDGTASVDGTCT